MSTNPVDHVSSYGLLDLTLKGSDERFRPEIPIDYLQDAVACPGKISPPFYRLISCSENAPGRQLQNSLVVVISGFNVHAQRIPTLPKDDAN